MMHLIKFYVVCTGGLSRPEDVKNTGKQCIQELWMEVSLYMVKIDPDLTFIFTFCVK
jgi:hypothetical protein